LKDSGEYACRSAVECEQLCWDWLLIEQVDEVGKYIPLRSELLDNYEQGICNALAPFE
jgi:hypothetical protein